jgi:hypothetical protein
MFSNSLCRARSRTTRDEHRAWYQAHYAFSNTAQEYVLQTGPSMRSHDNKVNVVLLRYGKDAHKWAPVIQSITVSPIVRLSFTSKGNTSPQRYSKP